jgi:hypothetical protein
MKSLKSENEKVLITAFVIVFANLTQAQTQLCISTEKNHQPHFCHPACGQG